MSIDDKLKEILFSSKRDLPLTPNHYEQLGLVDQIKQAFKDEEWKPPFHSDVTKEDVEDFANDAVKQIEGYSGKYWVSVSGKVYSTAWGKIREKKPSYYNNGYARVSLSNHQTGLVHRLVAKAWLPNPNDKMDVNHKDGNKGNNHVTNLEWSTRTENMEHAFRTGLIISKKGADHISSKLTEANVRDILSRLAKGESGTDLAKEYGVAHSRIYDIKNGHGWKHVAIEVEAAKRAAGLEDKAWTDEQGNKHSFNNGTETINYKGWEEIEDQKAQEDK